MRVRNHSNVCTSFRSHKDKAHCVPPSTFLQISWNGAKSGFFQSLLDEVTNKHVWHGPSVQSCWTTAHEAPLRPPPHPVRPNLPVWRIIEKAARWYYQVTEKQTIIPFREQLAFSYLQISGTIPETLLHEPKARFRSSRKARADIK